MKGLLLKDFYMCIKYCKVYLFMIVMFVIGLMWIENGHSFQGMFFMVYPVTISSLVPMMLLSYDERERWNLFSCTLPYTPKELVSVKYIIGIVINITVFLVISATLLLKKEQVLPIETIMVMLLITGMAGNGIILPLTFKFGVEKARIYQFCFILLVCSASGVLSGLDTTSWIFQGGKIGLAGILAAAVVLYIISWKLSIRFYEKREC